MIYASRLRIATTNPPPLGQLREVTGGGHSNVFPLPDGDQLRLRST